MPPDIDIVFFDWFVNNNQKSVSLLSGIPSRFLDSLTAYKKSAPITPGAYANTLSDSDGTPFVMGYATPSHLKKDSLYPLIIYLHGGTGTERNDKGEKAYDMFTFIADTMDIFLASPSANRYAPWWSVTGIHRILKTLRFMTLNFPIDPDRVILAGVSDGAAGCYAAANALCEPFAGFIAVSGFGGILEQQGIKLQPSNLVLRPIYDIHAGKDRLYPLEQNTLFTQWLEKRGVPVLTRIYPEQEHGFDYRFQERAAICQLIGAWRRPHTASISWTMIENVPNIPDNILSYALQDVKSGRTVSGYIENDTLFMRAKGISSFSIITGSPGSNHLFFKMPDKDKKVKRAVPEKQTTGLYLRLMQHYCNPAIKNKRVYTIKTGN